MSFAKKPTISDVAHMAGVSISTVSRVINAPNTVIDKKRQAVVGAMQSLCYTPNPAARALSGKRSRLVAVVVPNIADGAIVEIISGALQELNANSCDMMLFTSNENQNTEEKYLKIIQEKMVDAAIFVATATGVLQDFSHLEKSMPIALVDRYETQGNPHKINIDERMGFCKIIEHIKKHCKASIAYLAGEMQGMSAIQRLKVLKEVAEEQGIALASDAIIPTDEWTFLAGYRGFNALIKRKLNTKALICASDSLAQGALAAAREQGIKVPEEMFVFGFDNFPSSQHTVPSLTTLSMPHFKMGQMAAQGILQSLEGKNLAPIEKTIPVELILRDSTAI